MGALRPLYFSVYLIFLANLATIYKPGYGSAGTRFKPHNDPVWADFKTSRFGISPMATN